MIRVTSLHLGLVQLDRFCSNLIRLLTLLSLFVFRPRTSLWLRRVRSRPVQVRFRRRPRRPLQRGQRARPARHDLGAAAENPVGRFAPSALARHRRRDAGNSGKPSGLDEGAAEEGVVRPTFEAEEVRREGQQARLASHLAKRHQVEDDGDGGSEAACQARFSIGI